jgi:heme A synthase
MDDPGVFLEHAHRLLGALVGLTALATALLLSFTRLSKPKLLAWCIFVAVAVQGVLGGLRVTEISAAYGAVHGVLGQMIFGAVVALAVLCSERWLGDVKTVDTESGGLDRHSTIVLIGLLLIQVGLGAHMRHTHEYQMLILHITVATFALALAVFIGVRGKALYNDVPLVRKPAMGLIHITGLQIVLGIVALASGAVRADDPSFLQALAATLHQANGALLLAFAVRLALWNHRLLRTAAPLSRAA